MEKAILHTALGDVFILDTTAEKMSVHPVIMENFMGYYAIQANPMEHVI